MDRKAFYAALRRRKSGVFGTSLSGQQVVGTEGILDAFLITGDGRKKTLAYALATAYHETGRKMVPVREGFAKTDAGARRIVRNRKYGKSVGPYGHVYYGRGQVQLTWLDNYRMSSKDAGVDLVKHPDKALDPIIGARLLHAGLIDGRWNGRSTGIAFYLPTNGTDDLKNARRTVNITDKWSLIAGYYRSFLKAINEAGGVPKTSAPGNEPFAPPLTQKQITDKVAWGLDKDLNGWTYPKPQNARKPDPATTTPEKPSRPSLTTGGGVWAALMAVLVNIFKRKERS